MTLFDDSDGLHGAHVYCSFNVVALVIVCLSDVLEFVVAVEGKDFRCLENALTLVLACELVYIDLDQQLFLRV